MKKKLQLYLLFATMAIASAAAGQKAEIRDVSVVTTRDHVSIEVDLTATIAPRVVLAHHPDRLIADFVNVTPQQILQRISVNKNGVERVRVGLNRANPPVTRVVVDLESLRPYGVHTADNKVTIDILPGSEVMAADDSVSIVTAGDANDSSGAISELPSGAGVSSSKSGPGAIVGGLPPDLGFHVKGIAANSVYLDGGSNSGLQQGMKLFVRNPTSPNAPTEAAGGADIVGELRVVAVATASAVAEVQRAKRKLQRGDWAVLSAQDAEAARIAAAGKNLPVVAQTESEIQIPNSFVSGAQSNGPKKNLDVPGGTRMRGRIGIDYSGISSSGSSPGSSTQLGLSLQNDMTNLFGTHWNLQGYWRGRINRHSQFQEETIEDTLNKTYTMQLYYDNPDSPWVAGFGRLYIPWAVSLDTIDGGYFGRKLSSGVTAGVFAGSTPDLTSWDYAPDHRIAGSFINYTGGSFDGFHYSSTGGVALSTLQWKLDRPYAFFENEFSYKRLVSVYHSLIADSPRGITTDGIRPGTGISRSYLTVHIQPNRRLSFDVYHNYFRDVPTAATKFVGTGLVDKLLFQGVSVGVHYEPVRHVIVYTTLGRSERTGDQHRTLNQMYGLTWTEIARTGIRADVHYSKFDSNFGQGNYKVLSLSRQMTNRTFFNVQVGTQSLNSPFTANTQSKFAATSMDVNVGKHSFLQSGYTFVTGTGLNYRQWYLSWGYRFDNGGEFPTSK